MPLFHHYHLVSTVPEPLVVNSTHRDGQVPHLTNYFMLYSFVRIHKTLKMTPAMAANVTPKLWEMADMVRCRHA